MVRRTEKSPAPSPPAAGPSRLPDGGFEPAVRFRSGDLSVAFQIEVRQVPIKGSGK
jgi:hypothetical protein